MSLSAMYQKRKQMTPMYGQSSASPSSPNWKDQGQIAESQGRTAGEATGYGQQATSDYWNRISSFDPSQAVNKYAQGAWSQTVNGVNGFNANLGKLRGNAVGGGRLDTGFHDEDSGELYRSTVGDFGDRLSMTALDASRMQMQNNQAIGQFGSEQTERGLDLGVARREELINNAREKAERKRKNKRGIIGFLGGAGGAVIGGMFGGLPGAALGAKIGGSLGGGGGQDYDDDQRGGYQRSRSRYGTG